MGAIQEISTEKKIRQLLSTIFNRASIEQMVTVEYLNEEVLSLVERIQQIYYEQILAGDFSVDSLIDCLQVKDEEVLHQIAEILILENSALKFYDYTREEAYEDMVDQIINDLVIDYEIEIFSAYPAISKDNIPSIITWALDSSKAAYYVMDPPPGSFREYCREMVVEMYYNDAQNILFEECGIRDNFDDSVVTMVRKPLNKTIALEGK